MLYRTEDAGCTDQREVFLLILTLTPYAYSVIIVPYIKQFTIFGKNMVR
jgi:hypothetical protein